MGDGENDAEEPAGRRPLPLEDRIWRHPAEIAMEARRVVERRRARRLRAGATIIGGVLVISGIVWISQVGPADVDVAIDRVRAGTAADPVDVAAVVAAEPERLFAFQAPAPTSADGPVANIEPFADSEPFADNMIVVRSASSGEALAGALMVRDDYVVTSGAALHGVDDIVVSWGDEREVGHVIGHDGVTDLTVIRVEGLNADGATRDGRVNEGDEINMSASDGSKSLLRVVAAESTSAMANGDPVIGIVELDGRIGDVPPGTPAYAINGDVVGIATATADSAPAAIVPIGLAREVADEIIDSGEATHPWLGVTARDPNVNRSGSLVTAVTTGGPADAGGVVPGDVITLIEGHEIDSMASMVATLRSFEPGDVVELVVWRGGDDVECTVELASNLDVET